jgi:4-amino-4-deoxy-L-arabinose transferase-like glycosyltransferase
VLPLIVLAVAAVRLWVAAATGLVLDEAYYTLWSFFPSAGYLDHPPAIAWQIGAGRLVFGDTELGVRVLAVLNGVVIAAAIWRIGVLLFDRTIAALAVIWFTATTAAALGFVATPDSPSNLFWTLTLWAIAEFVARRDASWWIPAGLFMGLGFASKLTTGFLPIGLLLFLLTSAERRRWFGLWQLWAGVVIAVLVLLPVLFWNAENDWAMVLFQGQRIVGGEYLTDGFVGNFVDLIGGQLLAAGPILFLSAIIATGVALARRFREHGLALVVLTSLPIFLFMLQQVVRWKVEANWPVVAWPALSLAGASLVANWRHWAGAVLRWTHVAIGAIAVTLIYVQALWQPFDAPSIDRTREQRGWPQLQTELLALAQENGARWIATQGGYGLAAELWTYGRFNGNDFFAAQLDQRHRYRFMPELDPAALGRALFVGELWSPELASTASSPIGGTFLKVVERRSGDEVLGYYGVWVGP